MNEHDRDEEERGFKVEDRRRFSASGEPRAESTAAAAEAEADAAAAARGSHAVPDITFTTFVMSLSTQALVHLGEIEDPLTKTAATDLDAAKQLIDILGMLRDKTRGNVDETEERLLDAILYDLRLRYVERAKRAPSA